MAVSPHYWNQANYMESASDSSGQEEEEAAGQTTTKNNAKMKSCSESDSPSDDSLPRQSVMRRPPLPSTKPPSDYNPSGSGSSDSEYSSTQSQSESGSSSDREEEREKRNAYATTTSHRRGAHFGSDSDEEIEIMPKKTAVHKKVPFYSSNTTTTSMSVKSFYMDQEETQYGLPRRRAARNVKYNVVYSEDESNSDQDSRGRRKGRGRVQDSGSDSEFQMSGDGDEAETFESESMTEETSSDEYTPYARKRGGGGRKRRGKYSDDSDDLYGGRRQARRRGWGGGRDSSDESGSDYCPGQGRRRGRKERRKRANDGDWEDEGYTRTTGRRREHISYKESSDAEEEGDEVIELDGATQQPVEDNRECIDKILRKRIGKVGDTAKTCYMFTGESTGGDWYDPQLTEDTETEVQYLVKWVGWSHLHNTWESEESLMKMNVKGKKRFENYLKREEEKEAWLRSTNAENIEYYQCQEELNNELLLRFKELERVIAARRSEDGSGQEYLCKWEGLPYSECTWEDSALIGDKFMNQIDLYNERNQSDCIPSKNAKVLRHRPKFLYMKDQPMFLAQGTELQLRDYQLGGVNWLLHAWCKNNSVILADEMGLGKTIQTICFLSCLFHKHSLYGPFLIIVPLSTLHAWQREFNQWAPEMNTIIYIGDRQSRSTIQQFEWAHENGRLKFNVLITTYEILLKDQELLGDVNWAVLGVDEAHRLKNDDSLLYRTLMSFNTNYRLLVTGTPLQNSLKELWSLLHFIMERQFPSWDEFESMHQAYLHGQEDPSSLGTLHKQLEPFLFRRVKKDVEKSLPAKVEQILRVEMSSIQKQYYRWILTKNYKALSKGVKGSITGFINLIMELKKCCNHAFVVRPPDTPDVGDPLQRLLRGSGKLYLLDKLLVRLKETGHRVLIFSQMVMMLDVLAEYMQLRHFTYQRLDGSVKAEQRKDAIDHFNAEGSLDFCFLLSTRAGGLGVNLATADTVIIFDSDWNPQNDLQAQARAHRIGQTKQVNIYRLVTRNSVEEDIVERAKRKMVLDHLVIQRMDTTGRTVLSRTSEPSNNVPFDKDELNAVLKFGAADLFREGDGDDKALQEMDIDDILRRAETQESFPEALSAGSELLSQFKVASFVMDEEELAPNKEQETVLMSPTTARSFSERRTAARGGEDAASWDDIIPESYRREAEEEEEQREQLQLYLPPRQRTVKSYCEDKPAKITTSTNAGRRHRQRKPPAASKGEDDAADMGVVYRDVAGFSGSEIRRFVKSYRKFARPQTRLDAIAADAELQERSLHELEQLSITLHDGCLEAESLFRQMDEKDKSKGGGFLQLCGVSIPAASILRREEDLHALTVCIPDSPQGRKRLVTRAKPVVWAGVRWTPVDDARLLVGVLQYGLGNWESVRDDPDLGLTDKILPSNKGQKPQAQHLKTRAEYLLKILRSEAQKKGKKKHSSPRKNRAAKNRPPKEDITKYFKTTKGRTNERPKSKRAASDSEEEEEESFTSEESDSEGDFETEWKKGKRKQTQKKRNGGRPPPAKRPKVTHSRTNKKKSESVNEHSKSKKARAAPSKQRKEKVKRRKQESSAEEERTVDNGGASDDELDEKTFLRCKSLMKPVKKSLMYIVPVPDEDHSSKNIKMVTEIGNHIDTTVKQFAQHEQKKWTSYMWMFVAKFTTISSKKLYRFYKTLNQ